MGDKYDALVDGGAQERGGRFDELVEGGARTIEKLNPLGSGAARGLAKRGSSIIQKHAEDPVGTFLRNAASETPGISTIKTVLQNLALGAATEGDITGVRDRPREGLLGDIGRYGWEALTGRKIQQGIQPEAGQPLTDQQKLQRFSPVNVASDLSELSGIAPGKKKGWHEYLPKSPALALGEPIVRNMRANRQIEGGHIPRGDTPTTGEFVSGMAGEIGSKMAEDTLASVFDASEFGYTDPGEMALERAGMIGDAAALSKTRLGQAGLRMLEGSDARHADLLAESARKAKTVEKIPGESWLGRQVRATGFRRRATPYAKDAIVADDIAKRLDAEIKPLREQHYAARTELGSLEQADARARAALDSASARRGKVLDQIERLRGKNAKLAGRERVAELGTLNEQLDFIGDVERPGVPGVNKSGAAGFQGMDASAPARPSAMGAPARAYDEGFVLAQDVSAMESRLQNLAKAKKRIRDIAVAPGTKRAAKKAAALKEIDRQIGLYRRGIKNKGIARGIFEKSGAEGLEEMRSEVMGTASRAATRSRELEGIEAGRVDEWLDPALGSRYAELAERRSLLDDALSGARRDQVSARQASGAKLAEKMGIEMELTPLEGASDVARAESRAAKGGAMQMLQGAENSLRRGGNFPFVGGKPRAQRLADLGKNQAHGFIKKQRKLGEPVDFDLRGPARSVGGELARGGVQNKGLVAGVGRSGGEAMVDLAYRKGPGAGTGFVAGAAAGSPFGIPGAAAGGAAGFLIGSGVDRVIDAMVMNPARAEHFAQIADILTQMPSIKPAARSALTIAATKGAVDAAVTMKMLAEEDEDFARALYGVDEALILAGGNE